MDNDDANYLQDKISEIRSLTKPKIKHLDIKGRLKPADEIAIAVVGSRKPTDYGIKACKFIVSGLAGAGVTIISGLMYGIDIEAHKAALEAGGRTIAVLGYGMDYLPRHRYAKGIVDRVLKEDKGAIISQFEPQVPPDKWTFPNRNQLVAVLSKGVVVMEAAYRSGSLITAEFALEIGKNVFAVPGSIFAETSKGKHQFIKEGAFLADHPDDILLSLGMKSITQKGENSTASKGLIANTLSDVAWASLSESEKSILKIMLKYTEELASEEIKSLTGIEVSAINVALTQLELSGLVERTLSGKWHLG